MVSNLGYFLLISLLLVATSGADVSAQAPGPVSNKRPTPAAPNAPTSPVIPNTPPPYFEVPPSPVKAYTPPPRAITPPKAPTVAPYPPKAPVVAPPKTPAPAPAPAPAPYYGSGPPIKKGECGPPCKNRCRLHSRMNLCLRACTTCCERCRCVPPGTYGNKEVCGRCYTDMTTHGGRPKCP